MPQIFSIYLFTGDDERPKREAVQKLKRALLGKDKSEAFNFNLYDAAGCDIREVIDTLRSAPFISGKRLVLLTNIESAAYGSQKAIVEYAKNPSKSACLVLDSSKIEPKGAFYTEIKRYAREISYTAPKANRVTEWIQKEFKTKGKMIRHAAACLLKELKGDDIEGLRNEIDKLETYVGKNPAVSKEDVERIVGTSASGNVFEFVHALSRKDATAALSIAKKLAKTKKTIPEILGMIGWQFRRLKKAQALLRRGASTKDATIRCNIPPFFVQRFIKEIKSFTEKEIERIFTYLLDTDYSIKRGLAKPQDALELLIVRICSGEKGDRLLF